MSDMSERVYDLIELVGTSEVSPSEAIRTAITRAGRTLKGLDWFEVTQIRGPIQGAQVPEFQVKLKVGFRLMTKEELRGS